MTIRDKLISLEGRLGRRDWWLLILLIEVCELLVDLLVSGSLGTGIVLRAAVSLAFLWPSLALSVKRAHDYGKSGWLVIVLWLLMTGVAFVPSSRMVTSGLALVFATWLVVTLGLRPGTPVANQYGPLPDA